MRLPAGGHNGRPYALHDRREDIPQWDGQSGQHFRFLKPMARIGAPDFRLELPRNVTIGEACARVQEPDGLGPGAEVLPYLEEQIVGAIVLGDDFDDQIGGKR